MLAQILPCMLLAEIYYRYVEIYHVNVGHYFAGLCWCIRLSTYHINAFELHMGLRRRNHSPPSSHIPSSRFRSRVA